MSLLHNGINLRIFKDNPDIKILMNTETETKCPQVGEFSWNEMIATDEAGAKKFYTSLFGWTAQKFDGGTDYTLFKQGDTMIGGMMKCPKAGLPAHWLAYVTVEDVDAMAAKASKLGAKIVMDPFDVPTVGRIAVLVDPQGASIGLFKPLAS